MKKTIQTTLICVLFTTLFIAACSSNHKNELIYRFTETETAVPFDSLKSEILGQSGAEMLAVYPDSDVVIIHYDRFKTHQTVIEAQFETCGYQVTLLEKSKIEEKEQPWEKK